MKNKLYFVCEREEMIGEIVSARNWKEARKIALGCPTVLLETQDQLGVMLLKGGQTIWEGEVEGSNELRIIGGIVYTDFPIGVVKWDDVIEDLKKRKLVEVL